MTEKEAAKCLVELYADYELYASKLNRSMDVDFSEAVSMAIMALKTKEDSNE